MTGSDKNSDKNRKRFDWTERPKTEVLHAQAEKLIAFLVVIDGPEDQKGKVFRLDTDLPTTIGRDPSSDIVVIDDTISRQHARLIAKEDNEGNTSFFLYDFASANGSKVNDKFVSRHQLVENDVITLGRVRFIYKEIGN